MGVNDAFTARAGDFLNPEVVQHRHILPRGKTATVIMLDSPTYCVLQLRQSLIQAGHSPYIQLKCGYCAGNGINVHTNAVRAKTPGLNYRGAPAYEGV
jgi:hypothetical protein